MDNKISQGSGAYRLNPPAPIAIPNSPRAMAPKKVPAPQALPTASAGSSHSPASDSPGSGRSGAQAESQGSHADDPEDAGWHEFTRMHEAGETSRFNGYKRMSPMVRDAVQQSERDFPENIYGVKMKDARERIQVYHQLGAGGLKTFFEPNIGDENSGYAPYGFDYYTARALVHSHPYLKGSGHYSPSMIDHRTARELPYLEHIVQAPKFKGVDQYISYTGNHPPRFYYLVENPDNLPVSPRSPDGSMPPFRPRPESKS